MVNANHNNVHATFHMLCIRVHAIQIPDVIGHMDEWMARRDAWCYIPVTEIHSVMEAQHDPQYRSILNSSDHFVPYGYFLMWLGQRKGFALGDAFMSQN
jgi:UDP-N-acetyl-D-mannosaminuronic acid transferase (WecB/TagA/CpsF family)